MHVHHNSDNPSVRVGNRVGLSERGHCATAVSGVWICGACACATVHRCVVRVAVCVSRSMFRSLSRTPLSQFFITKNNGLILDTLNNPRPNHRVCVCVFAIFLASRLPSNVCAMRFIGS